MHYSSTQGQRCCQERLLFKMNFSTILCYERIALGLGLGAVVLAQVQRIRIKERMRYSFITWLNEGETEDGPDNNNQSTPIRCGDSNRIKPSFLGENSIMQVIANCNNSVTPNLHCSKVTLKKGTRTAPQKSKGVEVYYILVGTAFFTLNESENSSIVADEFIIVDPWT